MHGIERSREMKDPAGGQGGITKVIVRYSDGRILTFVADARGESFSEDDMLELKKVVSKASAAAEWATVSTHLDS